MALLLVWTIYRKLSESRRRADLGYGESRTRLSLRHSQGQDGRNALPDEDNTESRHRDGATRAGLQHDKGDEHHGCPAVDGRDEGITSPKDAGRLEGP